MQSLGRHDMGLHQPQERIKHRADRAHGVGHGRQRDRHAFQGVAFGLAVQGLVLAELLEQDHRQQAGARPSSRDDVERRGGWLIFSQSRQVNFSRTVSTTFH